MIKFSEKVQKYIKKLLLKQNKKSDIRIFIDFPGTSRAKCGMSYCFFEDIDLEKDKKFSYLYFDVFINKYDLIYLKDTTVDIITNNIEKKITLFAPYAKSGYQDKKTFSLADRVNNFLSTVINPQLLLHGGKVSLLKITDQGYLILNFSGSCNGCSMVDITLKEGIEKKIITVFPEIKGVKDITQHFRGSHSYY